MTAADESDTPPASLGRKRILVTLRRKAVTDKSIAVLATQPNVFQSAGSLVRGGDPTKEYWPRAGGASGHQEATRRGLGEVKIPPSSWAVNFVAARGT